MHSEISTHIDLKKYNFSFFGQNDLIKGEFLLTNDTFICNHIEGEVTVEGEKVLIIEPSGKLVGKIKGYNIEIHGTMDGEITAKNKVTLFPNCHFQGKIKAKEIEVHPGAIVEGDWHTIQ